MKFSIYRYNPETDKKPYMKDYEVEVTKDMKVLGALKVIKQQDPTLSYRSSCGEGVCGSDGMNINGTNRLGCVTAITDLVGPELKGSIEIRPLPGMPVIRDLVVDLSQFYHQYRSVKPYLIAHDQHTEIEHLQTPEERKKIDGLYECILCACCSTSCPSFWWNPDKFRGPAALLQAARFLNDSRDDATAQRLTELEGPYRLFRCHSIMNCTNVCPKGLNPSKAIGDIKKMMVKHVI
ncbi:MAG: succinate dehydrogenase iron-sulfur subunit [Gammaproteobacteria bacterium]|nr:succinate dehydrogenase iron-sulfur subunit [Gammaproteobacteria bacterium]